MISYMSEKLTNYLCGKDIISQEDKPVYKYGYEILMSTILGFIIVVAIGIVFNEILSAAIFYLTFVLTRQYCGGWHANSYLKCNIAFAGICTIVIILSKLLASRMEIAYILLVVALYIFTIWELSPMENPNRKFGSGEKKKFRKISRIGAVIIGLVDVGIYQRSPKISLTLALSLLSVTMLMALEYLIRKDENYEKH